MVGDRGIAQPTAIEIPENVYFQASDETSRAIAALVTVGVVVVLAIADFLNIFLAVAE